MGILNMLKGQLIDVIEWKDDSNDTMVHRYENNGKEIMMGAQLTVRESQVAIMVNEGKLADVFQPGRYELRTQNKFRHWMPPHKRFAVATVFYGNRLAFFTYLCLFYFFLYVIIRTAQ